LVNGAGLAGLSAARRLSQPCPPKIVRLYTNRMQIFENSPVSPSAPALSKLPPRPIAVLGAKLVLKRQEHRAGAEL